MKKRIISIIFSIGLIVIVVITGITMLNKENIKDSENGVGSENDTSLSEEGETLDDEARKEQEALEEEREAYQKALTSANKEENLEVHKGEYKDCAYSTEINPDFIVHDEYRFRQIYSYNEIEFLGYEELDDLSEYFAGTTWEGDEMVDDLKNGFTGEMYSYLREGYINSDGTLNKLTQTIRPYYGNDAYGEETVLENQEVVAVKLKIKYTNLSDKEIELDYYSAHSIEDLVFMDDGKLYDKHSVLDVEYSSVLRGPVYTNMYEKYGYFGALRCENILVLQPKEEYVGEVIYLFLKEDLDDVYFLVDSGYHGHFYENIYTSDNFNSPGIRFLPLTELKKLEGK